MSLSLNGLKIAYLGHAPLMGSGEGGTARIKDMVNLFLSLGIEINFVSYSFYSTEFKIEYRESNPLLKETIIHIPKSLPKFIKGLFIFPFFIYATIYSLRSDIIFSDLISVVTSFPAVILRTILKKPLILDFIDLSTTNDIDFIHRLKYVRYSDLVFAISPYLCQVAANKYGCKNIIYIPIFIDINVFQKDSEKREIVRKQLGIACDEIVIGYAGSFWKVEGIPNLLYAYEKLLKYHKDIKLAIIGKYQPNADNDDVHQLVNDLGLSDNVILIPRLNREDVPKYLSAFDILCSPKIDCEINVAANPVKVAEYLSMSIPTVSSAIGGSLDSIDDHVNGFLVKPDDIDDLEKNLDWILNNIDSANHIAKNGRKCITEKYSHDSVKNTVRCAIQELL